MCTDIKILITGRQYLFDLFAFLNYVTSSFNAKNALSILQWYSAPAVCQDKTDVKLLGNLRDKFQFSGSFQFV